MPVDTSGLANCAAPWAHRRPSRWSVNSQAVGAGTRHGGDCGQCLSMAP